MGHAESLVDPPRQGDDLGLRADLREGAHHVVDALGAVEAMPLQGGLLRPPEEQREIVPEAGMQRAARRRVVLQQPAQALLSDVSGPGTSTEFQRTRLPNSSAHFRHFPRPHMPPLRASLSPNDLPPARQARATPARHPLAFLATLSLYRP